MTGVWAEQLCKQPTEMPCGRWFFLRSTEDWPGCSQRFRVCVVLSLGCLWPLPHLGSNPNPTQSCVAGGNGSTYVRLNQGREPWQPAVSPSSNVGALGERGRLFFCLRGRFGSRRCTGISPLCFLSCFLYSLSLSA